MSAADTDTQTVPAQVARNLRAALAVSYNYVALIVDGKRPAITDHAREVAGERLERIEAAMSEADQYL